MLRVALSIVAAVVMTAGIFYLALTSTESTERVHGKIIYKGSDDWHGVSYKEVTGIGNPPDQDQWTLSTSYGEIHVLQKTEDRTGEFREAVNEAGNKEAELYTDLSLGIVLLLLVFFNRKQIEKKHPHIMRILLLLLPIYLLGTSLAGIEDAARASERAEKIFIEMQNE